MCADRKIGKPRSKGQTFFQIRAKCFPAGIRGEQGTPALRHDHTIQDRNTERSSRLAELTSYHPILGRRRRVSGGVVVHQNYARRSLPHRQAEDLPRVDQHRI